MLILRRRPGETIVLSIPAGELPSDWGAERILATIEVDRTHPNRVWWGTGTNARIGYIEVLE